LQGNASGRIVSCEPPRLLVITWAYGDAEPGEVSLRLSPDGRGGTLLELAHANVAHLIELGGRQVDPVLNDEETGIWGLGSGWELPLTHGLARFLRGEMPETDAIDNFQVTPEVIAIAEEAGRAWAKVVAEAPHRPN
jgi:hypothetical protein